MFSFTVLRTYTAQVAKTNYQATSQVFRKKYFYKYIFVQDPNILEVHILRTSGPPHSDLGLSILGSGQKLAHELESLERIDIFVFGLALQNTLCGSSYI